MKKLIITSILVSMVAFAGVVHADSTAVGTANQSQSNLVSSGNSSASGMAEQSQGQGQGQSQGVYGSGNSSSHSGVANSGNSAVEFNNSFNGAKPIRYLPVPSDVMVSTRGGPAYFGGPPKDNGPHFMSMKTLVNALNAVDVEEAMIDKENKIEFINQMINAVGPDEGSTEDTKFFLLKTDDVTEQFPGFKTVSVVTMKSTSNDKINSATLAVKLAKIAQEVQGSKIVLVSEGTSKKMSSWGVGIGFSQNYAFTNSDGNGQGGVSSGGTGWSWGESEFFNLPYLTAIIGN